MNILGIKIPWQIFRGENSGDRNFGTKVLGTKITGTISNSRDELPGTKMSGTNFGNKLSVKNVPWTSYRIPNIYDQLPTGTIFPHPEILKNVKIFHYILFSKEEKHKTKTKHLFSLAILTIEVFMQVDLANVSKFLSVAVITNERFW